MIYHDLRSPLANIVSSLDVLNTMVDFDKEDPTVYSLVDIAVRSTKRIQRLTHSMLDINRLEAGQPVIDKNPASLKSLLEESIDAHKPIIQNKKLEVILDIPEKTPTVFINWDMIQRVAINLIENALKYTPPNGLIKIGTKQSTNNVRVWVQDSGPGIPEKYRQSIFDKYTRLHGKGDGKGYGLGLAYCRLAVEGHGGKIWAENKPGGGSIFTFTLPIHKEEIAP
jgi:signal transduction histidine kinase